MGRHHFDVILVEGDELEFIHACIHRGHFAGLAASL
jgi:hypothetical protein